MIRSRLITLEPFNMLRVRTDKITSLHNNKSNTREMTSLFEPIVGQVSIGCSLDVKKPMLKSNLMHVSSLLLPSFTFNVSVYEPCINQTTFSTNKKTENKNTRIILIIYII
ncbi:hypothetical protein Hanom_Chr11g01051391 [Helianthus anomalus]